MGEAPGGFTLKAQFISLGNILGVDQSHTELAIEPIYSFYLIWKEVGHFQEDFQPTILFQQAKRPKIYSLQKKNSINSL